MKTRILYFILIIVSFSCGTNNKPVSDAQKEKIKGEVSDVVSMIYKGAEEASFDLVIKHWYESPDFIYSYNGTSFGYKDFVESMRPMFETFTNQKLTLIDEKFTVLDNYTVLYSANTKWVINFKDGHTVLQSPWAMQWLFRKIDGDWKAISGSGGGVEQFVKREESSKGLNQLELMKQYLGKAQFNGKDTTIYFDQIDKGKWHETSIKYVTKGKVVREGKQLWAYDKKADKIVHLTIIDGVRLSVFTSWFTSENKYIMIPYGSTSNSDEIGAYVIGEFNSPDSGTETVIQNNKPILTETYVRVK